MVRALAAIVALAGCGDAVTLTIASDRPIPSAIDAICVGIADRDPHGGHFGRRYPLATLPQTLRVEAGGASAATAWVRADRGGAPAAIAASAISFADDVTLDLAACTRGAGGAPAMVGGAIGPTAAHLVTSQGQGGTFVVALGADGSAQIVDAAGGALVLRDAPMVPATPVAAVAIDVDGDCDDDLAIATAAGIVLWRRDGAELVELATLPGAASAIAAADVDGDGAIDLIAGAGASLTLYRNDGRGGFAADPSAIPVGGSLTAVSAIAVGDLDGDGRPDLVVGQAGAPLRAWLGAGAGFTTSNGVVPAVSLDVAGLVLADADGDFDPDLAVAVRGAPMRLYVDRAGVLEDQSFVRLPQAPAIVATALAIGGFDDACEPDAVALGGAFLRGRPNGVLEAEATAAPAGTDVVLADIDDDGDLDAIVATSQGVVWFAR